jgi:hypothetical protein
MVAKAEVRPRPLKVEAIKSTVDIWFCDALRGLKLNVLGTDDSPIPITGQHPLPHPLSPNSSDLGRKDRVGSKIVLAVGTPGVGGGLWTQCCLGFCLRRKVCFECCLEFVLCVSNLIAIFFLFQLVSVKSSVLACAKIK